MCGLALQLHLVGLRLHLLLGSLGCLGQLLYLLEILVPHCFDLRLEVLEAVALLGFNAHQLG